MTEQAKAARNEYRREWAKRNPDKLREYQARYWDKKAAAKRDEKANENT